MLPIPKGNQSLPLLWTPLGWLSRKRSANSEKQNSPKSGHGQKSNLPWNLSRGSKLDGIKLCSLTSQRRFKCRQLAGFSIYTFLRLLGVIVQIPIMGDRRSLAVRRNLGRAEAESSRDDASYGSRLLWWTMILARIIRIPCFGY